MGEHTSFLQFKLAPQLKVRTADGQRSYKVALKVIATTPEAPHKTKTPVVLCRSLRMSACMRSSSP